MGFLPHNPKSAMWRLRARIKAKRGYWTTQHGENIAVADMRSSHVMNTIHYVAKRAPLLRQSMIKQAQHYHIFLPVEHLELILEKIYEMSLGQIVAACCPEFRNVKREAFRRKLITPEKFQELFHA